MIYPDFNRYILIEFLKILTNSYTLSKIVKNQKKSKIFHNNNYIIEKKSKC